MSNSYVNKQSDDYQLTAACWHESAHTICGLHNFMKVYRVHVRSNEEEHGRTHYELYDSEVISNKLLLKILLIYEVQTLYAGLVGERMYYKDICGSDAFPMHLRIGSSDDIKHAALIISKYNLAVPGKNRSLFKKQIQRDVKDILMHYWSDVRLIAHCLYKFKDLNFKDLRFYLTHKSDNQEFWKQRFKDIKTLYANNMKLDEKYLKDVLLCNAVFVF